MERRAIRLIQKFKNSYFRTYLPWMICIVASLFYTYELCVRSAMGVMVTEMQQSLHIGHAGISVLSASYYYVYTPMQLFVGILIDRIGAKKLLIFSAFVSAIGSWVLSMAHSLFFAGVVAQMLLGFSAAFAWSGVVKFASGWLPHRYFNTATGLAMFLGMIISMGSGIAIAHFLQNHMWQSVWKIFSLAGVVMMFLFAFICVNRPLSHGFGGIVHTPMSTTWNNLGNYFRLIVRDRLFWLNAVVGGLLFFPVTVFGSLWSVSFLTYVFQYNKITATEINSFFFLGWAVGALMVGWLAVRLFKKRTLLTYGSFFSFCFMCLILIPIHWNQFFLSLLLFFLGASSSAEILVFDLAAQFMQGSAAGCITSWINCVLMLVCAILQPTVGFFLRITHFMPIDASYRLALSIVPFGLLLAWMGMFFLYREECSIFGIKRDTVQL